MAARLGINLSYWNYFSPAEPYLNYYRKGSGFVIGGSVSFDQAAATYDYDPSGWLSSIGSGTMNMYLGVSSPGMPSFNTPDNYMLLFWEGSANPANFNNSFGIAGWTLASVINWNPAAGSAILSITPHATNSLIFQIDAPLNSADYIRNVRLIPQIYSANYFSGDTWHPKFVEAMEPFECIRFINQIPVNDSEVTSWNSRRPSYWGNIGTGTWTNMKTKLPYNIGVPFEDQIQLGNDLNKDIWLTIPHLVDDTYVSSLAILAYNNLDAGRKLYIEYSNEVWNGLFSQSAYVISQGTSLFSADGGDQYLWGRKYFSRRTRQCMDIFTDIFTSGGVNGLDRLKRVVAWQSTDAANMSATTSGILEFEGCYSAIDIIAMAPYMGGRLGTSPQAFTTPQSPQTIVTSAMTDAQVVSAMLVDFYDRVSNVDDWKAMAEAYGKEFALYECGQHLVGVNAPQSTSLALKNLFASANRHDDMRAAYVEYHTQLENRNPNGLAMVFSDVYLEDTSSSYDGMWGILEGQWQDKNTAPKWLGLQDFITEQVSAGNGYLIPFWLFVLANQS